MGKAEWTVAAGTLKSRQTVNWEGLGLAVATTDILLIAKLEWARRPSGM